MAKKTTAVLGARMLSAHEVADLLGLNYLTVWRWTKTGKLNAVKIGKDYKYDPDYIAEVKTKGLVTT